MINDTDTLTSPLQTIQENIVIDIRQENIDNDFNSNLAEILPEHIMDRIAGDLLDDIEDDFLSRKDWEDGLKKAFDQLGLKIDENKEFPFPNASGIYSQVMMQAITEFYSQAVAELLPLEGPVKELIIGQTTEKLEEQARRVETFANYYFTQKAPEFYADFKKMLPWVGLAGMSIRKVFFDPILKRPTSKFFKAQDFVVNYSTTSLSNCWRMTEVIKMNAVELARYKMMGIYRHIDISPYEADDQTDLDMKVDEIEGTSRPSYNKAHEYELYECHTYLDMYDIEGLMEDDEEEHEISYRPYRITLHKESGKILAIYRNWREGDPEYKRKDFYVDYGFMDGFGFYKLGAAHLIGGIASGCTTLLRQYIDGMTLANFPGGMHVKGMRLEDNNIRVGPTEFIPVDTQGMPIQDSIMLMPYKEPSPGINELRKELEMAAGRLMGAANQQMGEFNPNAPVGTTFALLDMINLIQSTVIRSLRDSMTQEVKLFYDLFAETLPLEYRSFVSTGGSFEISAADFSENIKLVPVADPHVTTKMQRLMRAQMIVDMANQSPDLYDRYEANLNLLREVKMTDSLIKKLLPDKNEVPKLDPVSENERIMLGKPVKAYIDQDHAAHRIVVQSLLTRPDLSPEAKAAAAAHDAEHQAFEYQIQMQQMLGIQFPDKPEELPYEVQNQIAAMAANVVMQQAQQQEVDMPPPPLDPAAVMLEDVKVKAQAIEQKAASDQLRAQIEIEKAKLESETKMKELEFKLLELQQKMKQTELELAEKSRQADLQVQTKAFEVGMKAST